jgi:hypothetical protein
MSSKTEVELAGLDRNQNIDRLASENDIGKLATFLDQLPGKSKNGVGLAIQLKSYESLQEFQALKAKCPAAARLAASERINEVN